MEHLTEKTKQTESNVAGDYTEKCVICGADTPYKFSTPISKREYYVEGAGQTCVKCHRDLYSASKHTD